MENECVGCGLCEAMCHRQAVSIGEDKNGSFCKVDHTLCDHCGVCDKVCPIENLKVKENLNEIGQVAIGRSLREDIVCASASGGIVTEILMYLFRTGEIGAAIVAFYDKYANIYGDVIESEEDVRKHSGSYYHTSKQLINVQKIRNYKKVAVVGVPCHIEGIVNYCRLTKQKDKVVKIALFCTVGRTYRGFQTFFGIKTGFNVAEGKVAKYVSRYGPDKLIHIEDNEGKIYECPDELYKFRMDFFYANKSCFSCRKLYGLSADISVGDAWHRVKKRNGVMKKMAIISANTALGRELLNTLHEYVSLEYVDNGAVELVSSQKYGASLKQLHKVGIVRSLDRLRAIRRINDNAFLFHISCRLRAVILKRLEKDTKILAEKMEKEQICL